jgi:hypothetical protein
MSNPEEAAEVDKPGGEGATPGFVEAVEGEEEMVEVDKPGGEGGTNG